MSSAAPTLGGRGDLTRVPFRALRPISIAIECGDRKYREGDWLERDSRDDVRAALGHIAEFLAGSDVDHETGESPLAHAAARLLFVLERDELGQDVGGWRALARGSS